MFRRRLEAVFQTMCHFTSRQIGSKIQADVNRILRDAEHKPRVAVKPEWYY